MLLQAEWMYYLLWPHYYLADGVFFRAFYGPIMTMTSLTLLAGGCACRDPLLPRDVGTTFFFGGGQLGKIAPSE